MMQEPEVVEHLQRIEEFLAILVKRTVAGVLSRELRDSSKKELYELTGALSASAITKRLGCSATTVCETWRRWEQLGILIKDGRRYRKVIP
jgi:biotin operon repressor